MRQSKNEGFAASFSRVSNMRRILVQVHVQEEDKEKEEEKERGRSIHPI